jgi:transposase
VPRYRADLVAARTAEKQRAERLLEDACIKLSVVASDIFGTSGRDMMAALMAGERSPRALAQLARTSMRRKTGALEEAFTGHFASHHAFLLAKMLTRVDAIDADIAGLDERIEAMAAPFAAAVSQLDEIPGVGLITAAVIIAGIGTRHDPLPLSRPPGLVGQVRTRGQTIRRQEQGQRPHRARQPLPGARPRRGSHRGVADGHLPR